MPASYKDYDSEMTVRMIEKASKPDKYYNKALTLMVLLFAIIFFIS